ncbi:hypothetical protein NL676_006059 [Syzygium grande]|nr:hypothetical protein NL676_006059 [Syzygium grande]
MSCGLIEDRTIGRSAKQKEIDDWLPITSSRNAKWWYSTFHNVAAMVGAGVLSLPHAMGPGVVILALSWVITLYTLSKWWRCTRWSPGSNLAQPNGKSLKTTYFIMILASAHFVLAQNFDSISMVSLAAAVMSLRCQLLLFVYNFLSAQGDVAFVYVGHNVVLEIQATIPSTPEKPSKGPMWRGVVVAYIVAALCYFPVALLGYLVFRSMVEDNTLISLEKPKWSIILANASVVIHVIVSYQYVMTCSSLICKCSGLLLRHYYIYVLLQR